MTDAAGGRVSIGVAGALGPEAIGEIARAVEEAGFHALWVNDTPAGDALAGLAGAARTTGHLVLATGVLALDRRPGPDILRDVRAHRLPEERLVLGVGSGPVRAGALDRVRDGVRALREGTSARVVAGALGPRMRRLAATEADGLLLSWLTPEVAAEEAAQARALAPDALVALYVRTALEAGGAARRDAEAETYGAIPSYAANFARLGVSPRDTVLPRPGDDGIRPGVAAHRAAVDEVVLRAMVAGDDPAAFVAFVRKAAAALA